MSPVLWTSASVTPAAANSRPMGATVLSSLPVLVVHFVRVGLRTALYRRVSFAAMRREQALEKDVPGLGAELRQLSPSCAREQCGLLIRHPDLRWTDHLRA